MRRNNDLRFTLCISARVARVGWAAKPNIFDDPVGTHVGLHFIQPNLLSERDKLNTLMSDPKNNIRLIMQRAEEILQTAKHGYDDLVSSDRTRRFTGLRNLIVFGRSVTFVLQNLKSVAGEQEFNNWYEPKQEEMKQDPLLKYFVTARNEILKQGKLNVATSAQIHSFSTADMHKFGPPPSGAKGFFIGDQSGGTGWEVELPDGSIEKYYVDLPTSIGEVKQHFADIPEANSPELKGKPVEELCRLYLTRLETLVDEARKVFLEQEVQRAGGKKLPSYIRVVK